MRNDKELIQICLDNFSELFILGLCPFIDALETSNLISFEECKRLEFFIEKYSISRLNLFSSLYDERRIRDWNYGFYWDPGQEQPRIEYLEYLLERFSK